jgi:hypothetical protein
LTTGTSHFLPVGQSAVTPGRQTSAVEGHALVVSQVVLLLKWQQMSLPGQSSSLAQTMG